MKSIYIFFLTTLLFTNSMIGQTCDLGLEDFTGSSSVNPPAEWMISSGVFIGESFPPNSTLDPAASLNLVGENVISKSYLCASQICFDWHSSNMNSLHQVEISYTQGDGGSGTTWTQLDIIQTPGSGNTPTTYQNVCYTIPNESLTSPFDVKLRWNMIQRTSGTFYIENVCAEEGSCTVNPTQFTFSDIPSTCKEENSPINVLVCATDASGSIDQSYSDNITISKLSGSGNISGNLSSNATNGCVNTQIIFSNDDTFTLTANSSDNMLVGNSEDIVITNECPNDDTLRVMTYNLLNFPNGRDDCGSNNTVVPNRWDSLAIINTYLNPDVLLVCELQTLEGADSILNKSLNINGVSKYMAANFVPNQSSSNTDLNNMFYYNSEKMTLYDQEEILTSNRDFNKYTVFMNDPNLATSLDTVFIDFYMAHLKAGNTPSDRVKRQQAAQILRDYIDNNPSKNNVLCGDLNLYSDTEDAYQTLTSGTFPFDDPTNQEGNWNDNQAFADVLTQSTRAFNDPPYDCGATGGTDSRFDFILTSQTIEDSTDHVSVIPGTYTPVGNDGSTFNQAINSPTNTSGVPPSILNTLYFMSDHIPVTLDLKITYPETPIDSCIYVYSTADSGEGSLRSAIGCAENGSVITFSPDIKNSTIVIFSDSIQIDKDITLKVDLGSNITVAAAQPQNPNITSLFHVNPGKIVTFEGFQIDGAFGPNGSGICNEGDLTLDNMVITNGGKTGLNSVFLNKPGAILRTRGSSEID